MCTPPYPTTSRPVHCRDPKWPLRPLEGTPGASGAHDICSTGLGTLGWWSFRSGAVVGVRSRRCRTWCVHQMSHVRGSEHASKATDMLPPSTPAPLRYARCSFGQNVESTGGVACVCASASPIGAVRGKSTQSSGQDGNQESPSALARWYSRRGPRATAWRAPAGGGGAKKAWRGRWLKRCTLRGRRGAKIKKSLKGKRALI